MPRHPAPHPKLRLVHIDDRDASLDAAMEWRPGDGFDAMFDCFVGYVATIGLRLLGREDEVDDLIQEVFCKAWQHIGSLREPGAVKGWLATITVRQAQAHLRRRRARRLIGLDQWDGYHQLAVPCASADERLLVTQLFEHLDRLSSKDRVAWSLRHLQGERISVVAERCGCSISSAKRRIARAQAALREVTRDE